MLLGGKYNTRRLIFLTLAYSVISTLIIVVISSIMIFSIQRLLTRTVDPYSVGVKNYRYTRIRNEGDKTSSTIGFVSMPKYLSRNEYVFHEESDGESYSLISNFGEEEYMCTGSCFCNKNRRGTFASPTLLKRGMTYLLAATSLLVANQIAQVHFSEECTEQFSDECSQDEITTVLEDEDCLKLYYPDLEVDGHEGIREEFGDFDHVNEDKNEENGEEETEENKGKITKKEGIEAKQKYLCRGSCQPTMQSIREGKNKEFRCEDLSREGVVTVYPSDYVFFRSARVQFNIKFLTSFCWESSKYFVEMENGNNGNIDVSKIPNGYTSAYCYASLHNNPSVDCRKVDD